VGLFWNRQPQADTPPAVPPALTARLADAEAEIAALKQRVVRAEQTVADVAERAYKYMKKAEARARRELDEPNQEPAGVGSAERVTPATSGSRRVAPSGRWGARSRWGRMRRSDPVLELVPDEATG